MALPSEEIKEKLDIVQVLRDYMELRPAGKNLKGLCPFHSEKTPSFIVSTEKQIWHCFGCNEGGDIFKFLMKYENIEFYEALKILAEKAGIELRHLSPADQRQFGVLYDVNSVAAKFFSDTLEESERAKQYLSERHLNRETMYEFELGFASNNWDALTLYLINNGFDISDVVRSGLAFKTEKGKYIDRFRGRIMFPIHNSFGKIVGFSGRVLPEFQTEEAGKYVNSPETPIFNKSRLLYGLWKSKNFIREKKTVLLVEGQMDFLMLWQDGVKNLVATSGTALTVEHLKNLRKIADRVVLSFDNDAAGLMATERAIDLAGSADLGAHVLSLGEFKDPAEVVEKSPGKAARLVEASIPAMNFYFDRYLGDETISKRNVRIILSRIKKLWSHIDQAEWMRELSHRTRLPAKDLVEEMERIEMSENFYEKGSLSVNVAPTRSAQLSRLEHITLRLLNLMSLKKELLAIAESHIIFLPKKYALVYGAMKGDSNLEMDVDLRDLVQMISLRSSLDSDTIEEEKISVEFKTLLKELELEYLKEKMQVLARDISLIQDAFGDDNEKLKEFQSLTRRIQEIENAKEN